MTRYFMRDTPLCQLEQQMMTPPNFKARGHGRYSPGFQYSSEDTECPYCINFRRNQPCPLKLCICLDERIAAGALNLNEFVRDCFFPEAGVQLLARLERNFTCCSISFFLNECHRERWQHWRERYYRMSGRNLAALFLLTAYEDSVAGAPVEGARFHVTYTSNGEAADAPATIDFGEFLTDSNGEIRLHEQGKRLYPGEYTITEVEPAPGFQMVEPTTQKIILHGGEKKTVTFQNTPLNAIIVEKYDSVTGEALPGCTFQLRYLGGTSGTGGTIIGQKVTGKNGTAIWTSLKPGTYILEEVDPADGYSIIQSSETVYLADSGEQSVVTVRFKNMPDGNLLIRKVCSVNPSVTLQDAEFKVMYADGTLIGDNNGIYRTDENGEIRIEGLAPGKSVVVTETKAPAGFLIDTQSQTIQIKEGRTVSLTFKNQPKGELIIQKRDSATGKPLPGAEFRVTTAAGCEVGLDGVIGDSTLTQNGIFTTDSNGEIHITNLAPGAYVISELKAPSGYVIDQPTTNVVIGENGDTQTVVIKNSKAGSLIIDKRDSLTGKPLEGVTFKVTTSTGEYVPDENGYISSNGLYFTDKDGKIQIDGVVGTLVVTETATIPGYSIDPAKKTQTVQVNPNDTQTLYFTNTPSTTLVIEKYIEGTHRSQTLQRLFQRGLAGTHSTSPTGSHTVAHTGKQGELRGGVPMGLFADPSCRCKGKSREPSGHRRTHCASMS